MLDNHNGTRQHRWSEAGQPHFVSPSSSKFFLGLVADGSTQISEVSAMFGFGIGDKILGYIHGCLILTSFWQTMYRAETHFSLVCISGYFETRTYV